MNARVDVAKVLMPKALKALQPTSNYVNSSGLDHLMLELVKLRTSGWILGTRDRLLPAVRSRVVDYARTYLPAC